jgi:hypothetical protein
VDLGNVIGGGDINIYSTDMDAIMKWLVPMYVVGVSIFFWETQYLGKFIASFSVVSAPLHTITTSGKSFKWGENRKKAFDEMKRNTSQAQVLALPNLQNPF